jgi:hypothetical protein
MTGAGRRPAGQAGFSSCRGRDRSRRRRSASSAICCHWVASFSHLARSSTDLAFSARARHSFARRRYSPRTESPVAMGEPQGLLWAPAWGQGGLDLSRGRAHPAVVSRAPGQANVNAGPDTTFLPGSYRETGPTRLHEHLTESFCSPFKNSGQGGGVPLVASGGT